MFPQNVSTRDRDIRLAAAAALMITAIFLLQGVFAIIAGAVALILFGTAALGFCPLYTVLGVKPHER